MNSFCYKTAFRCGLFTLFLCVTAFLRAATPLSVSAAGPDATGIRWRISLNQDWRFFPGDTTFPERPETSAEEWVKVSLPHTWNAVDTLDDVPGYRQGVGWYRKTLMVPPNLRRKRLFLYFEGVNQTAEAYVNGQLLVRHLGGYTAFACEITKALNWSPNQPNVIAVRADNSPREDIPPSSTADFNRYGGIYRDVWLLATEPTHFAVLDYAAPGLYVETPTVTAATATVKVRGTVVNQDRRAKKLKIVTTIFDAGQRPIVGVASVMSLAAGAESGFEQNSPELARPRLWSPETPYLYRVQTQIFDAGRLCDELTAPLGFRWFSLDPATGFRLNGQPYRLRGANRHQDYAGLGNALPDSLHLADLRRLKHTGFNLILLAHYPQDPALLAEADRLGLLVWEEVPIIRQISPSAAFADNCRTMLTEMIRQHYNHPSVIFWCYMNEIFLRLRQEANYVRQTVALAQSLEDLARREDSSRLTVISANRPYDGSDIYNTSGLLEIPRVVAWHMYFGWYYGELEGFGKFLDEQHLRYPQRVQFVSEYGADNDPRLHSLSPRREDFSSEWAQAFHESYLRQIDERPYLAGSAVWALNDFGAEMRGEAWPHVNTKGLFTFDRRPKDIAYFYEARLTPRPVLHIAADWPARAGLSNDQKGQPLIIYSNLPRVELFLNNQSLGAKEPGVNCRAVWETPLKDGWNTLEARGRWHGQEVLERVKINFTARPKQLAEGLIPFRELAVDVGAPAQFIGQDGRVWETDQPYAPGSWGYVGGALARSQQNIRGTAEDPLYQTYRLGLAAYRFDVPDGDYALELHFIEPAAVPEPPPFSLKITKSQAFAQLIPFSESEPLRAQVARFQLTASEGKGLSIEFTAPNAQPALSAILVRRIKPS